MEFKFNKKRVRILSDVKELPEWTDGVIYWTFRDERIHGELGDFILSFINVHRFHFLYFTFKFIFR